MKKLRSELTPPPKSYRISAEAIAAVENLCLALDLPRGKVIDLAIIRLHDEWRAGRLKGITLQFTSSETT